MRKKAWRQPSSLNDEVRDLAFSDALNAQLVIPQTWPAVKNYRFLLKKVLDNSKEYYLVSVTDVDLKKIASCFKEVG